MKNSPIFVAGLAGFDPPQLAVILQDPPAAQIAVTFDGLFLQLLYDLTVIHSFFWFSGGFSSPAHQFYIAPLWSHSTCFPIPFQNFYYLSYSKPGAHTLIRSPGTTIFFSMFFAIEASRYLFKAISVRFFQNLPENTFL